jgi:hypothetical protein
VELYLKIQQKNGKTVKNAGLKNESEKEINKKEKYKMASGKSLGTINYRRKLYGNYALLYFARSLFPLATKSSFMSSISPFIFQF